MENERLLASLAFAQKRFAEAKTVRHPGAAFVYVLECRGFYKIGVAKNLGQRLSLLQIGCPFELIVVGKSFRQDPYPVEKLCHDLLNRYHLRGEWFDLPKPVADDFIKRLQSGDI